MCGEFCIMGNTSEDQELNTLCGLKCDQIIASLFIVEFVMCYIYSIHQPAVNWKGFYLDRHGYLSYLEAARMSMFSNKVMLYNQFLTLPSENTLPWGLQTSPWMTTIDTWQGIIETICVQCTGCKILLPPLRFWWVKAWILAHALSSVHNWSEWSAQWGILSWRMSSQLRSRSRRLSCVTCGERFSARLIILKCPWCILARTPAWNLCFK